MKALDALYGETIGASQIQLQRTRKEFNGEFTVVVFPLLKLTKASPEESGEQIGNWLKEDGSLIEDFQVVKGFLNLTLQSTVWVDFFGGILKQERYGLKQASGRTVILEYSSPNTNKPLHLGHIRNNVLGYSVARILEANGHKVIKTQIINDRGIHICKSMIAWLHFGEGETPESAGVKGDHLVGKYYVRFDQELKKEIAELVADGKSEEDAAKEAPIQLEAQEMLRKWEAEDEEVRALWTKMNGWVYEGFDSTYKALGVAFDKLYYESDTWILGKEFVSSSIGDVFEQKEDGSVWCDLEPDGLDKKLVLRSDGTAVYMTQDIGTAVQRYKDFPDTDQMIYTVGNEQEYHFKVLFKILGKLGYEWADACYHLSYGMVELPEGKMKSREGTVVDADDLINEMITGAEEKTRELGKLDGFSDEQKEVLFQQIGLAALKYFILKVDPRKGMMFDPQESIDLNGNTGPFIQYTYARIQSLLTKATVDLDDHFDYNGALLEDERELLTQLQFFPEVVAEAGEQYSPALIANYTYELVKTFNRFYQSAPPILKSEDAVQWFRLQLSRKTGMVIQDAMSLLGIEVPDRM